MKPLPLLMLAAACLLLLPSCVFCEWHLGKATIELSQIRKGVDGEHPIGLTMYAPATWDGREKGMLPPVYAIEVPEVSYVHRSDLVVTGSLFTSVGSGVNRRDITPTGRTRWLLVTTGSTATTLDLNPKPPVILNERPTEATVDGHSVKLVPHPIRTDSGKLHPTELRHTAWCIPAYVVATPLFALDYSLDLVCNTGAWVAFFIGAAADAIQ